MTSDCCALCVPSPAATTPCGAFAKAAAAVWLAVCCSHHFLLIAPSGHRHPFYWLRCVTRGLYTGLHCDQKYFDVNATPPFVTLWLPLTDVPLRRGALVVVPRSHRHTAPPFTALAPYVQQPTPVGGNTTDAGWLEPAQWRHAAAFATRDFAAGDVVVIHPLLLHQTAVNVTDDERRITCDLRFFPI